MCKLLEKNEFVSPEEDANNRIQAFDRQQNMLELVRYITTILSQTQVGGNSTTTHVTMLTSPSSSPHTISYLDDDYIFLSTPGPIIDIE